MPTLKGFLTNSPQPSIFLAIIAKTGMPFDTGLCNRRASARHLLLLYTMSDATDGAVPTDPRAHHAVFEAPGGETDLAAGVW